MLRPTDTLRADHGITALGLSVLRGIAEHVRAGEPFPSKDAAEVLRFLREFVIAVHMRRESDFVCPAVAMCGDERAAALVGDLMRLQDEVTELLHSLVLFWEPSGELTQAECEGFAEAATTFAARVLRMQRIEEDELFPACDAAVPPDDQLEWNERFAELEHARGPASAWQARLAVLAQRWRD